MKYIIGMLIIGYIAFTIAGVRTGHPLSDVVRMSGRGLKRALALIIILLLIGMMTGLWRDCGTIVAFVYYGVQFIRPHLFLVVTFLLTCLLSYALGTSFGVAGTAGVIFMVLARSGGVDPVITAGVILSGIYFGDRSSPASSTALTVASITDTDLYTNVRNMHITGAAPWLLCLAVYGYLSWRCPIHQIDASVLDAFSSHFSMSMWCFLPAVFLLVMPLLRVSIQWTLCAGIVSAGLVAVFVQGHDVLSVVLSSLRGYVPEAESLRDILSGGGMSSMATTVIIIGIACSYTGIMDGTGWIVPIQNRAERLAEKIGLFPSMLLITLCSAAVFCNQIIGIMMCNDLMTRSYKERGRSKEELAVDIENCAITMPALIPWCILITVPLAIFDVSHMAVLYGVYIYAVPLLHLLGKGLRRKGKK